MSKGQNWVIVNFVHFFLQGLHCSIVVSLFSLFFYNTPKAERKSKLGDINSQSTVFLLRLTMPRVELLSYWLHR